MFLKSKTKVVPTDHRDYPEWHHGRQQFALWYIEITDQELLSYLQHLRDMFSEFLYQPNTRQFHITLFICGFLTQHQALFNDDFKADQLHLQLEQLKLASLLKFRLKTKKMNSFESALFVEVEDVMGVLQHCRQCINQHSTEIAPLQYCPHITLGLYREAFPAEQILKKIDQVQQQEFSFSVDKLTFGYYQPQQLQGTLYTHKQLQLG